MKNSRREGGLVVLLASVADDNVTLVAMADEKAVARGVSAGKIVKEASAMLGGGGGGRPAMAQGGGRDARALPRVFAAFQPLVEGQVKN
jgi:alanyl-tRNA synthetase